MMHHRWQQLHLPVLLQLLLQCVLAHACQLQKQLLLQQHLLQALAAVLLMWTVRLCARCSAC
jgi:DMSO/TMAO reductase YedYZ heme-binding membrane subunit